ncbi:rhomboid family intramembrane serine protease [Amycolatopsis antarctica]|uniref:Rhomboid family intramembrane serine protease n=1 Tax=Amycolatopsis antarctica TaxID=1854586 RepID=A0A263D6Y0_9PSEU|nr:rhomboid family intramembrane serine protease [Amycolatopsis antarctica]OZM74173.1 rhomboid family intramembrane serine protease [Amycolatopsis antarctica]
MPIGPAQSGKTPETTNPAKRIVPANPKAAGVVALAFTVLLYLVELVDRILPGNFEQGGIAPRSLSGIDGIAWAPILHGEWSHLVSNTVPVLVFGFLAMAAGIGQWLAVTATIWIVGGLGVWLMAPPGAVHIGASGLAFGWLAYLLVRGIFNRSIGQLVVAVVLFGIWGGMLWGVFPGQPGISWQGHLFGALGGVLAAWLVGRSGRAKPAKGPAGTGGPASAPGSLGV